MRGSPPVRLAVLATHPVQYYAPLYRALAAWPGIDLEVLFAHRQDAAGQARAGFQVEFEWDVPLLEGYAHRFLSNRARRPDVGRFFGCSTPQVGAEIRAGRYDAVLVHGWWSRSYLQAVLACRAAGVPVFVRGDSQLATPRPAWKTVAKAALYRRLISLFDAFLFVGDRAREYYLHYGAPVQRLFFSPHCVDNDFFRERAAAERRRRAALRRAWGLPPQRCCFLFAGKLVERKRPLDFIDALGRCAGRGLPVAGLVVGDGSLRAALEARARETGVPIGFTGFLNQSQLPAAYAAADVLVLPSDARETWGLVVNEAMAAGLPAVVSDQVGCAPDLLGDGRAGRLYPCGDVPALAAAMEELARERELRQAAARAAVETAARYSPQAAAGGVAAALEACRRSPTSRAA